MLTHFRSNRWRAVVENSRPERRKYLLNDFIARTPSVSLDAQFRCISITIGILVERCPSLRPGGADGAL